ncbi:hypothetical protein [Bosea sp. (in: a-proteobacteria)]
MTTPWRSPQPKGLRAPTNRDRARVVVIGDEIDCRSIAGNALRIEKQSLTSNELSVIQNLSALYREANLGLGGLGYEHGLPFSPFEKTAGKDDFPADGFRHAPSQRLPQPDACDQHSEECLASAVDPGLPHAPLYDRLPALKRAVVGGRRGLGRRPPRQLTSTSSLRGLLVHGSLPLHQRA